METILIHPDEIMEPVKKLHGVNNGPQCHGNLIHIGHYYEDAGFPLVRLHDVNWPHPREVDIPTIFPNGQADPRHPRSYDFSKTDEYIRTTMETGCGIVYRLGVSIEHTQKKYFTDPPSDFEKWAEICCGIIRHYTQGWADGFHYGIKYWEIWNEPENPHGGCMWTGTLPQYLDLYRIASMRIAREFPEVKIGGPAAAMVNLPFLDEFLDAVVKAGAPLHFFSWHTYTRDLKVLEKSSKLVREKLDTRGLRHVESHLNEWGFVDFEDVAWREGFKPGNEHLLENHFLEAKNERGAAFIAAALIRFQDWPLDMANFYDSQPNTFFGGLFSLHGVPQKSYFAMKAFHLLAREPVRVKAESRSGNIAVCATADHNREKLEVLISVLDEHPHELTLLFQGKRVKKADLLLIDATHRFEPETDYEIVGQEIRFSSKGYTVALLTIGI